MHPELFDLNRFTVHSYGTAILLGSLIGGVWAWRSRPPKLFDLTQYLWICILTTLGASWGARGLGLGPSGGETGGGLASTGVPLLVGPLILIYCRWSRLDWRRVFDHLMPFAVFGAAFQRTFGCFLGGCCRGRPSDSWLAVRFPDASEAVHPTQLYLGLALFIFFFALRRWPLEAVPGQPSLVALGLYGLVGCLVSPLRAGIGEPVLLGLTTYGLLHGVVALLGLGGAWLLGFLGRQAGAPGSRALGKASA